MDVVDPDGDLAPWQVDISASHGYVTLNRTAAAPLRFALGGLGGAHRLIFAATPAQLAAALAGATVRIGYRTNATSLYLPVSPHISHISPISPYISLCLPYISLHLPGAHRLPDQRQRPPRRHRRRGRTRRGRRYTEM